MNISGKNSISGMLKTILQICFWGGIAFLILLPILLFAIGKHLNRKSACLLTVVDSIYEDDVLTSEEREKTLDEMIVTALDAIVL